MRILFIITRADTVGGAQVHVRDLASALIRQGHEVLVVTGVSGPYNIALDSWGVHSLSCKVLQQQIDPVRDWQAFSFLMQTIRQFQPDLVSTHSSKAGILGRLACRVTNTPCIFTAHGWAFTGGVPEPSRTIYRQLERLAEPLADRIICVSEQDRLLGIKAGMKPDRLLTVHNGMPDIPPELKANPADPNPVRIVMIARFDKQKDHLTLLQAFQSLLDAQLDLVGDGPKLEETKATVDKLGIGDRVNFLGYCNNVAKILAQAHIFTLISNWEGFPRTIIEAMRAGLPVVASNVGGVTEALKDGVTGYCVPRGDVTSLRDRLSKLVSDAKLRRKMGCAGRQCYEVEFTFQRMFEQTFRVYEDVLN